MTAGDVQQVLQERLERFLSNALTPYSGKPAAAALLLPNAIVVPGVRVESASFSLTIPAALNAITTAVAAGYLEFSALAFVGPAPLTTTGLLSGFGLFESDFPGLWTTRASSPSKEPQRRPASLPEPLDVLDPYLPQTANGPGAAIRLARDISRRAHIPQSNFPVGATVHTENGKIIPGVNVEHADWTCILCAERNALGTAVTYGALPIVGVALSCPTDPGASPCGACRQLLAELAPMATIWMDRSNSQPTESSPEALLPLAFSGKSLGR